MRLAAATALAAAVFAWAGAAQAAPGCPAYVPEVVVSLPEMGVETRRVGSVASYARFPVAGIEGTGWTLNGLTVADTSVTYALRGWQGADCYSLARVEVTVGFAGPVMVYVPERYALGTCPAAAIMAHEMQHVEVHRLARLIHAPRIKAALEAALPALAAATGQAEASAIAGGVLEAAGRDMSAAAGAANAALDTQESYDAVKARCTDW